MKPKQCRNLIKGVGVNDADYKVAPVVNGVVVRCPYYLTWINMLDRCYNLDLHLRQPTYAGCTVCEEWLIFSKFKAWMETQDWKGKQLDKDILYANNKQYNAETCAFVSRDVNMFLVNCLDPKGASMVGVTWDKHARKFRAQCSDRGKRVRLGYFDSELEAHKAWKEHKIKLALILAGEQTDERIADAIKARFL